MLFGDGFTFSNFVIDVLPIFAFVVWFWFVTAIFADLFRRSDISGWAKAAWVIALILTPYIGVLIYGITRAKFCRAQCATSARSPRWVAACGRIQCRRRAWKASSAQDGGLDHRRRIHVPWGEAGSVAEFPWRAS